jgi:LPPG:FO 2-phospho-L-lactate transferase
MLVTALAGGVGGSKLLIGLQEALRAGQLTAVVNTADDTSMYGVHVSPDVDIVTYWLAGLADAERGWGIAGDSFAVVEGLARLGRESWFRLGDTDLATCLFRTERMSEGATLSAVTDEIRRALGIPSAIVPMSDDPVRTQILTDAGTTLDFQDYFVRLRQEPSVREIRFAGLSDAKPAPGVLEAIADSERVIVCPSNPLVSVAPILSIPGVRSALRKHPKVIAVSPIVAGSSVKGPAARMLSDAGTEVSARGVAALYQDFCDVFVVDRADTHMVTAIEELGLSALATDTMMVDPSVSRSLADTLLEL